MGHSYYSVPFQLGNFPSKKVIFFTILLFYRKKGFLKYMKNILVQLRILFFNFFLLDILALISVLNLQKL